MAVTALNRWRSDSARWLSRNRVDLLILVGVWLGSSAAYFLLARGYVTPRHQQDEFLYWALSKSFAAGDGFSWRGDPVPLPSFLYPVSISPAFHLAASVQGQFNAVHAINSLMMCATLFPAFFMARMFIDRSAAYIATAFALLVPAMNYVGLVGTEPLAYPTLHGGIRGDSSGLRSAACAQHAARGGADRDRGLHATAVRRAAADLLRDDLLVALMRGRDGARAYLAQQKLALAMLGAGWFSRSCSLVASRFSASMAGCSRRCR